MDSQEALRPSTSARWISHLRGRNLLSELGIFCLFVLLAVVMTWPLAKDPRSLIADVGFNDPLMCARFLHEVMEWLSGRLPGPFEAGFFFPHPHALTTNDPAIGVAIFLFPLRLFTDDYLLLVNLAILISFPLTAHATYLLARTLTASRACGFLAGAAFGFCFFRIHHLDHMNVLQMQWLPYSLYFLHRLRESPRWSFALGGAGFFFLNGIGSHNIGLYTAPVYFIVGAWSLITAQRGLRGRFARRFFIGSGVAVCALLPFYLPYLEADTMYGLKRTVSQAQTYSVQLEQLLAAPSWSLLYGKSLSKYLAQESATFLGMTILLLAAFALLVCMLAAGKYLLRKFRIGRQSLPTSSSMLAVQNSVCTLYFVVGLVYFVLSLGPEMIHSGQSLGKGPWSLLMLLPGYGAVRTPARFFLVTALGAALLAGIGARYLSARISSRWRRGAFLGVAICCVLLEAWVAPIPTRQMPRLAQAPATYRWLAAQKGPGAVLEVPAIGQVDERWRMYFAMVHGRPTVDAESGFFLPVMSWIRRESFFDGSAAIQLERLHGAGLRFLVLHPKEALSSDIGAYRDAFGKVGADRRIVLDGDEIFELPLSPVVKPFTHLTTLVRLQISPWAAVGRPLSVFVHLSPGGSSPVFERGPRRLSLHFELSLADPVAKGSVFREKKSIWFAPALLAPAIVDRVKVDVPVPEREGIYKGHFLILDEKGDIWQRMSTVIVISDSATSPERMWRKFGAGSCAVRVIHVIQTIRGDKRLLVLVENRSATPWEGPILPELRACATAGESPKAGSRAWQLGCFSPSSSGLYSLEVPGEVSRLSLVVGIPSTAVVGCEATIDLAR